MTEQSKIENLEDTVKSKIELEGVDSLAVDNLKESDLGDLSWAGDAIHIEAIKEALERAANGDVEYLAVRAPNGRVIAKGGIDYEKNEGSGYMWQLTTMESLRGLGIGTRLIKAMEERIKAHGLNMATLGVETDNPLARELYERLGYEAYAHDQESWNKVDNDGRTIVHHADIDLMRKEL